MTPSFAKILIGNSTGSRKKSTNKVVIGNDAIHGIGSRSREKNDEPHIYPVIEDPTKTVQMPELAIKGIEALTNRALVCCFNGFWPKLVDLHTWLEASWKPLLSQTFTIYPYARGFSVIDFDNQEDTSTIVEFGPWFQGSSGLFMQHQSPTFNISTTSISIVLVWFRLPNLPLHLWNDPSL